MWPGYQIIYPRRIMRTILYLTDLAYQAKGRNYCDEDLFITATLRRHFNILTADPRQAIALMERADMVVFRNTGPVIYYRQYFEQFVTAAKQKNIVTFNSLNGKGDMAGKQYLVALHQAGLAVIPTVEDVDQLDALGDTNQFVVKIKDGADSIGMEMHGKAELLTARPTNKLIQPLVPLVYEVSFYYINTQFQYALYAPNKAERWRMAVYEPTPDDLLFAYQFIGWNNMTRGITRVDACRLPDGRLLLVELEDLNPYLSINILPGIVRNQFIENLVTALKNTPSTVRDN